MELNSVLRASLDGRRFGEEGIQPGLTPILRQTYLNTRNYLCIPVLILALKTKMIADKFYQKAGSFCFQKSSKITQVSQKVILGSVSNTQIFFKC